MIMMKVVDIVANKIDRLPKGYVFTYKELDTKVKDKEAVIKALNRMVGSGKLAKLSRGKYYKPEESPFGNVPPDQYQVFKDLLEEDGKIIGYLTGYSIFNILRFTTQISFIFQIGKNQVRPEIRRSQYRIKFIKQKNQITRTNIRFLQILDCIRFIKKIPAASIESSVKRLLNLIDEFSQDEKKKIVRLAMNYPPSTRALLGAILDQLKDADLTAPLLKSLNPITKYKFTGAGKSLATTMNWNIV